MTPARAAVFDSITGMFTVSKDNRPVNLELDLANLPVTAFASITHRAAGIVLFVGTAILLWALDLSLSSEEGFETLKAVILHPIGRFVAWGLLAALAYHFVAGVKHLLLDMEIADTKEGGAFASKVTLFFSAILIGLAGVWMMTI